MHRSSVVSVGAGTDRPQGRLNDGDGTAPLSRFARPPVGWWLGRCRRAMAATPWRGRRTRERRADLPAGGAMGRAGPRRRRGPVASPVAPARDTKGPPPAAWRAPRSRQDPRPQAPVRRKRPPLALALALEVLGRDLVEELLEAVDDLLGVLDLVLELDRRLGDDVLGREDRRPASHRQGERVAGARVDLELAAVDRQRDRGEEGVVAQLGDGHLRAPHLELAEHVDHQVVGHGPRRRGALQLHENRCRLGMPDPDRQELVAVDGLEQHDRLFADHVEAHAVDDHFLHGPLPELLAGRPSICTRSAPFGGPGEWRTACMAGRRDVPRGRSGVPSLRASESPRTALRSNPASSDAAIAAPGLSRYENGPVSGAFVRWAIQDSNLGPLPYQRSALTD